MFAGSSRNRDLRNFDGGSDLLFVWAKRKSIFFHLTLIVLKLWEHLINVSMMTLAKGISITRPAALLIFDPRVSDPTVPKNNNQ